MPEHEFEIWLDDETKIYVYQNTRKGHFIGFSVVLMILTVKGWIGISRFDTAHGMAHQDVLGKKAGLLQKKWHDHISGREAFHLAIETFKKNHEHIRKNYFAN